MDTTDGGTRWRVLCLEDSVLDAELVRQSCAQGGLDIEMDLATERGRFEELLASLTFDVILADYALPGFDAHEALQLAKSSCPDTPFICVSGVIGEEATVELLKAGADDVVLKDRLARLRFAVQRAISERNHRRLLRESEERFALLFNEAPLGYQALDHDGRFIAVNAAWLEALGFAREEVLGRWFGEFLAPDYVEEFSERFDVFKARGEIHSEFEMVRRDGERRMIAFEGRIGHRPDGDFAQTHCILTDITERRRADEVLRERDKRLEQALADTIAALGATVAMRDPYTAAHERRVSELACRLAERMSWSSEAVERLRTAALVHDIGKIIVPAEILAKPARLTESEFALIKAHAAAAHEILAPIDFGGPVAEIVLQHHERLDGTGYPQGLSGDQILPGARLLAVADVVEAMVTHRPYRPALPLEQALAEIEDGAGSRYDADACEIALGLFRDEGFTFST